MPRCPGSSLPRRSRCPEALRVLVLLGAERLECSFSEPSTKALPPCWPPAGLSLSLSCTPRGEVPEPTRLQRDNEKPLASPSSAEAQRMAQRSVAQRGLACSCCLLRTHTSRIKQHGRWKLIIIPTYKIQTEQWFSPHCVHIRQTIGSCYLTPNTSVIH